MLSRTAEYALRAAVWLAANRERAATTETIAAATRVPADYLSKVMRLLGRGGLVDARRGRHGGFTLLRPPTAITALEVVNAVDPVQRIGRCPLGRKAHLHRLCPLHSRLDSAAALLEDALGAVSIAELCEGSEAPLCDVGKAAHV